MRKHHAQEAVRVHRSWQGITLSGITLDEAFQGSSTAECLNHTKDGRCLLELCAGCGQAGHLAGRCSSRERLCVCGDSHTSVWTAVQKLLPNTQALRTRIGGMSAYGLANPASTTQACQRISEMVAGSGVRWLFIMAGQVDVDFVFHYRAARDPALTFEAQAAMSRSNLLAFLQSVLQGSRELMASRIIVLGAHPPPLGDGQMQEAMLHHMTKNQADTGQGHSMQVPALPSHQERTAMTIQFNEWMQEEVEAAGFEYISIAEKLLDPTSGVVQSAYLRADPTDIHLADEALAPLYLEAFQQKELPFACWETPQWSELMGIAGCTAV